jgi:hypothetical protein
MDTIGERHSTSSAMPVVNRDPQVGIASRLHGTWKMLSWTTEDLVTGLHSPAADWGP